MTDPAPARNAAAVEAAARRMRRLVAVLGGGALLIAGSLAAMPWFVTRPRPAPEARFKLLDGRQPSMSELRGQVLLLNFWSVSCATCKSETPILIEFHRRNARRGLNMIAVAMSHDRPSDVIEVARENGFPFDVSLDVRGEIAHAFFRTDVTPTKYLIDRQGQIVRTMVGHTDFVDLQQRVDGLLIG